MISAGRDLEFPLRLQRPVGKVADREFLAALEHANLLSASCEAGGCDTAAISGPHDNNVVAQSQFRNRFRQLPHDFLPARTRTICSILLINHQTYSGAVP
ncbi:hypothetical protein MnTg02_01341 [bacterium MnTg02]|nr:hypothetical protein MnTg02_01341 [bacterium MnTg02]